MKLVHFFVENQKNIELTILKKNILMKLSFKKIGIETVMVKSDVHLILIVIY